MIWMLNIGKLLCEFHLFVMNLYGRLIGKFYIDKSLSLTLCEALHYWRQEQEVYKMKK